MYDDIKIDFRDDISVDLVGLKNKDYEYIKDYCRKQRRMGYNMGLSDFVMSALRYYLKELRKKKDDTE